MTVKVNKTNKFCKVVSICILYCFWNVPIKGNILYSGITDIYYSAAWKNAEVLAFNYSN